MKRVNCQKVKEAIQTKWPKLTVKFEEDPTEQGFIIGLGDDYTTIYVCLNETEQKRSQKDVFLFISTGNDEIKDTTVYKNSFDLDPIKTDEENIIGMITESLETYSREDYRFYKPLLDDLERMNVPDMMEGEHVFQKIEELTGITYL